MEYTYRYGRGSNGDSVRVFMDGGGALPFEVLNGDPGRIDFLDALNAWQLVRELKTSLQIAAAASFQHGGPSSAALGIPLSAPLKSSCFVDDIAGLDDSPLACACARARGGDRLSAYGDFVALSDVCDTTTARILVREASDGVIAPGFEPEALAILKGKRDGGYQIVRIDPDYMPAERESQSVFGVTFEKRRGEIIGSEILSNIVSSNRDLPTSGARDLLLALITVKYSQPFAACCTFGGQVIGIGAGQRSQIHCTRLACAKADNWYLRMSPKVLALPFWGNLSRTLRDQVIDSYISRDGTMDVCSDGLWPRFFSRRPDPFPPKEQRAELRFMDHIALASDGLFAFPDCIERANRSGVCYVAQPGGSVRDDSVIAEGNSHNMVMVFTGT